MDWLRSLGISFDTHLERLFTRILEGKDPHWDCELGYCLFFIHIDPDTGKAGISYENPSDYKQPSWDKSIQITYERVTTLISQKAFAILINVIKGEHCEKTTTINIKCHEGRCVVVTDSNGVCPNNIKLLGIRTFKTEDPKDIKLGIFVPELIE